MSSIINERIKKYMEEEQIRKDLYESFESLYSSMIYDCLKELRYENDVIVSSDSDGGIRHFSAVFTYEILSGNRDWDSIYKCAQEYAAWSIVESEADDYNINFNTETLKFIRKLKKLDTKHLLNEYDLQIEKVNDLYNELQNFIKSDE